MLDILDDWWYFVCGSWPQKSKGECFINRNQCTKFNIPFPICLKYLSLNSKRNFKAYLPKKDVTSNQRSKTNSKNVQKWYALTFSTIETQKNRIKLRSLKHQNKTNFKLWRKKMRNKLLQKCINTSNVFFSIRLKLTWVKRWSPPGGWLSKHWITEVQGMSLETHYHQPCTPFTRVHLPSFNPPPCSLW